MSNSTAPRTVWGRHHHADHGEQHERIVLARRQAVALDDLGEGDRQDTNHREHERHENAKVVGEVYLRRPQRLNRVNRAAFDGPQITIQPVEGLLHDLAARLDEHVVTARKDDVTLVFRRGAQVGEHRVL